MTTKAQDKQKVSEIDEGISKVFDIKKRLGKGAYGIVWKALDKRTNETIAVKKIFDAFRDETDAQRTFREIIFLKAFRNHPNIIKLHNIYTAANNLDIYLIFEYMESDLHNIIKRGTILKDVHKRFVMYQLINAIQYIHSGNVIHRDLKPSNILIDTKCRCKLADFGLARSVANHYINTTTNNDMSGDKPTELLLTDYVATRWYRAPEILVASKRYTKGIDMWSLGCILAEMLKGKPLFQGTSTINQIEKIVYTLPDITDHDIRSVGAGFGSVLFNKQVLSEKKTTLSDLLCGATEDALDLVKSLLVLDPIGRLTAHQALNHPYVQKFRNSVPELELNVDILPPFRDDIRLTVPEYRSKLYEIVQTHVEKHNSLDKNKNSLNTIKSRDHKSVKNVHERSEQKKIMKVKQYSTPNIVEGNSLQNNINHFNIVEKGLKKTTPLSKSKSSKSLNNGDVAHDEVKRNIKNETHFQRSNRRRPQNSQLCRQTIGDQEKNLGCSTNKMEISKQQINPEGLNRNSTKRLQRTEISLYKAEYCSSRNVEHLPQNKSPAVRQAKSDVLPLNNTPSSESSKVQERICYEKRLKELEEEIERYKNEVKNFCRETFRNSQQKQQHQRYNEKTTHKCTPKNSTAINMTPIKKIYFQLLSKGNNHKDYRNTDLDLTGNIGDRSNSIDNFKNSKCSHYNKILQNQQMHQNEEYYMTQKHQSQHRCRPISKFV